VNAVDSKT